MSELKGIIKNLMKWLLPGTVLFWKQALSKDTVSITFDDGPHQEYTPAILDLLKQYNVKATFFVVGKHVEQHPEIVRRIIEEGHELGNHSYEHNRYQNGRLKRPIYEIKKTNEVIEGMFGYRIRLYRPPFGAVSPWSLLYCIGARLTTVMWSVDSGDYTKDGNIEAAVRSCTEPKSFAGDVLLFHDHNPYTVMMLESVLEKLSSRGLVFKTAGQLVYET